jgi:hypothetical protein
MKTHGRLEVQLHTFLISALAVLPLGEVHFVHMDGKLGEQEMNWM